SRDTSIFFFPWKLEFLKQGLRILIRMPQIINEKDIIVYCEALKRQSVLLKILLKIYGIFVVSG
uniref:Uncharacterized protein n=1 Tax=Ursus americanus TaxID=9643 RepID=A0A452SL98_URSAM